MVAIDEIDCVRCKQKKWGERGDAVCGDCLKQEQLEKKQKHLEELSRMTLEERVRLIEEKLYNQGKKRTRMLDG